ncbi:MAG TPA: peptidylprolyl isomerase [Gemmatimonadaceae bacterium]|nr:peptidylprolyl isomerase [Gemmatimonadaceae bacterium]
MRFRLFVSIAILATAQTMSAQRAPIRLDQREIKLYSQLLAMTDTRQLDSALIDRLLAARSSVLRAAGALAVGQVGTEKGMSGAGRLRGLLRDNDANVAAKSAYALGLLRDSGSVTALAGALASTPAVAREAAWALGEIGVPARGTITSALASDRDDGTTIQLLLAAAKLRPLPITQVRRFFHANNPAVVWAAAYAVARQRSASGVRDLIDLERSAVARESPAVGTRNSGAPYDAPANGGALIRAEIARALSKSAAGDSLAPSAYGVLNRLATDTDAHVRINALRSLGTYGAEAKSQLQDATRDPDPNVRIAAAQSLANALTSRDQSAFESLWNADTATAYRAALVASAARVDLITDYFVSWVRSNDWHKRAAVAAAAGDTLDRQFALMRTSEFLNDPDPRVREAAIGAIAPPASMRMEDTVHNVLLRALRDPDFYVRATAIAALTERPSVADVRAVIASYHLAQRDSANDARLAAIQYIAAVWKKDSASMDSTMRTELAREAPPTDPLERAAGHDVPFWKGWSRVRPTPRSSSWYERIVRAMVVPSLAGRRPRATIQTVRGPIVIELFGDDAPITAWNFLSLARSGYYRSTSFHRVVPNFVAQDGDPRDDGNGGPGYAIRDEMNPNRYERGAVGMALSGPDTGGSQYFITHSPQPHLDGHYTVFGKVVRGYDVLDRLVQGDRITRIDTK